MKKALKVLGMALVALLLIAALAAIYNQFAPLPTYEVEAPILEIRADSIRLARGAQIASGTCSMCHLGESGQLDGALHLDDPAFGKIYASNITQHPDKGIGQYSDGELFYLFRTGVMRNGKLSLPMMIRMPHLSDEDLYSVIAYLRSSDPAVQASAHEVPPHQLGFIGKALSRLVFQPVPFEGEKVMSPNPTDKESYGKYLATDLMQCANCHSSSFETYNIMEPEKSPGLFAGGNLVDLPGKGRLLSPNITMHPEKGIGKWTEAQFIKTVRERQRPNGTVLNPLMPDYGAFSDHEISSIWAYLQTIPISDNDVVLQAQSMHK